MKIKELFTFFESGNTKAARTFTKHYSSYKRRIYFELGNNDTLYGIDFQILDKNLFLVNKHLKSFLDYNIVSITFGNVLPGDVLNFKKINQGAYKGLKILSVVKNIIRDIVIKENIDIIIFSAKKEDGVFENRSSVYSLMATDAAKRNSFSLKTFTDDKGTYFILLKDEIVLSTKEYLALKSEVIENLSFKENLKIK